MVRLWHCFYHITKKIGEFWLSDIIMGQVSGASRPLYVLYPLLLGSGDD